MAEPLLSVSDLTVEFKRRGVDAFKAVDGISFEVKPGQTVGLVGESGCGKSVTSLAIMRLLPTRGNTVTGQVMFDGTDLLSLPIDKMRDRRGRDLAMVFQDPLSSLNPVVSIGIQVTEVLERHRGMKRSKAMVEARELLEQVGIPDPNRRLKEYPHQLSGGMRQRALIAMALACRPRLLIADEPTTALDVTIQAQILALLKELVVQNGTALVMITHDLGVVAGLCDTVNVLYGGKIVERAERHELFESPRHPYTHGLLDSIPRLDAPPGERLQPIPGSVNDNIPWIGGCAFAPRCGNEIDVCREVTPELVGGPAAVAVPQSGRSGRCDSRPGFGGRAGSRRRRDRLECIVSDSNVDAGGTLHGEQPHDLDAASPTGAPTAADVAHGSATAAELSAATAEADVLLEVNDLKVHFPIKKGVLIDRTIGYVYAVDGVSLAVRRGETYGLVGESGCGKSTLGRGILRLTEPTSGEVIFDGVNIAALKSEDLRRARRRMQMVFQDPLGSLDPRQSVQSILVEGMRAHGLDTGKQQTSGPAP